MASRTALQSLQAPLRSSVRSASRQSLPLKHHQANCRQQSRAFHRGAHSRAAIHHTAYITNASNTTATATATVAGILAVSALALWLDHHGLQIQLLQSAKADENITSPTFLDETPVHLDPDTSIPFPAAISPIGVSQENLKLVGLGVRTVSFLRVKVYSAGAYVSERALAALKGHDELLEGSQGEALVAYLLDQSADVAVRIVPTRNTDHSHLRDGYVRAILARMKQATSTKQITEEQAETASKDLDTFKGFFPSGKVSKGKYMLVTRRGSDGALLLEYEGKLLGTVNNSYLSKQLLLAYFADNDKEISPKLKSDVVKTLEKYL